MSADERSDGSDVDMVHEEPDLIMKRERRSNAGNRLQALLNAEDPLEDEEMIFAEFEDDEEFEEGADEDEDEDEDEEDEEVEAKENKEDDRDSASAPKPLAKKRKASEAVENDDENFSSSESEEDEEQEAEDAGERELQKQQREDKRRKDEQKKKKMFEIKALTQRVKKKESKSSNRRQATAADLLNESRRVSKRAAVVNNTKQVIERLQEDEARRLANLPVIERQQRKKAAKKQMTQEERLEEAKVTEKKNLASLNQYFEMEEARKQRQRAAMLARRKPLVNVIRYVSSTQLVPPKRIFTRPRIEVLSEVINEEEPEKQGKKDAQLEVKEAEESDEKNQGHESKADVQVEAHKADNDDLAHHDVSMEEDKKEEDVDMNEFVHFDRDDEKKEGEITESTQPDKEPAEPNTAEQEETPNDDELQVGQVTLDSPNVESADKVETQENPELEEDANVVEEPIKTEKPQTPLASVEPESATQSPQLYRKKRKSSSHNYDLPDVQGPWAIRQSNTITLLNFANELDYTRVRIKSILFGKQGALAPEKPVLGVHGSGSMIGLNPQQQHIQQQSRTCTITGKLAKFTDPDTGIKYATMDAFSMISLVKDNHLKWNTAMGGVYKTAEGEKHAKGVPPGFAG